MYEFDFSSYFGKKKRIFEWPKFVKFWNKGVRVLGEA